jgi:hypothetical protein
MSRLFCLSEDRPADEVGVRLALCSLFRHVPAARVALYRPNAAPDFAAWVRRFPAVEFHPAPPAGASTWNCKPHALLPLLARGEPEVVWLDSDLLVTRDVAPLLDGLAPDTLLAAEEQASSPHHGTEPRTRGWGLEVGRSLPVTLNSCVLRVTPRHGPLLERWQELLGRPEYAEIQRRWIPHRPLHAASDQDVLNALVGAREFAHVPVRQLRRGLDVLHSGGALAYSFTERLRGLFAPKPAFIHGQGAKPWAVLAENPAWTGWFWFYRRLLQEAAPYVAEARSYRAEVGLPCPWLDWASPLGRVNRALGLGHHALRGLPLTALATVLARFGVGR